MTADELVVVDKLDLANLRSVAEAATPGPWFGEFYCEVSFDKPDDERDDTDDGVSRIALTTNSDLGDTQSELNANHIVAFNPATALALLNALEEAQAVNDIHANVITRLVKENHLLRKELTVCYDELNVDPEYRVTEKVE